MINSPMADRARGRLTICQEAFETWCNVRYSPTGSARPWLYCRLPLGHDGPHSCPAEREVTP